MADKDVSASSVFLCSLPHDVEVDGLASVFSAGCSLGFTLALTLATLKVCVFKELRVRGNRITRSEMRGGGAISSLCPVSFIPWLFLAL